jgi:hypothetical protein
LGRELSKARRLEYISTIDPRRYTVVYLIVVQRIGTLGESEGGEFETLEPLRAEEIHS